MSRVVVNIKAIGEKNILTYDNGVKLGSLIYDRLRTYYSEFATELHNSFKIKPYSVSNIRVKREYFVNKGKYIEIKRNNDHYDAYFYISSLDNKLLKMIVTSLMNDPDLYITPSVFEIQDVKVLEAEKIRTLKTITPALFYDSRTDHFMTIEDYNRILNVIRDKVRFFGGDADGFRIKSIHEKVVRFKGRTVPGHIITIKVKDEYTGKILYNVGVGHKTTLSFGFTKKID